MTPFDFVRPIKPIYGPPSVSKSELVANYGGDQDRCIHCGKEPSADDFISPWVECVDCERIEQRRERDWQHIWEIFGWNDRDHLHL